MRKDVQRVAEQEDLINLQSNNGKALLAEVQQLVVWRYVHKPLFPPCLLFFVYSSLFVRALALGMGGLHISFVKHSSLALD